jgi:hypothetical protein
MLVRGDRLWRRAECRPLAPPTYVDFDLLVERVGDGFRARVLDSPAGEASTDFTLPFDARDLEMFELRVLGTGRRVRDVVAPEMGNIKDFGAKLFDTVFAGPVGTSLARSLDLASSKGEGLRIRIRTEESPNPSGVSLLEVPWEFLYDRLKGAFVGLSETSPVVRYPNLPQAVPSLAVEPPLNVLVMISSPSGFPTLDVEQEMGKLETATAELRSAGRLTLHRLESPTLEALQAILRRGQDFHVFHFVGHGGWDAQSEDGLLLLQDESGKGQPVTGEVLEVLLGGHDPLRLAILNACEGARTSAANPFAGVAQTLVRGGVPSVIAMQLPISDEAAIALSGEFYAALADGYPVDAALAEARKAIFARVSAVEWAIPVLYLRAVDGTIFDVQGANPDAHHAVEVPLAGAAIATTGAAATTGGAGGAAAGVTESVGGTGTTVGDEEPTPRPQPVWRKYWWAGLIGVALVVILAVVLVQALGGGSGFTRTSVPGVSTDNHLNRVAAGSDLLVAVGQDGNQAAVWTSPDGTTWSEPEARLGAGTINMVIPVEQGFVAVGILGNSPEVWLSPDGGTWTHATSIEGPIAGGVKLVMNRVTAVGDRLFAVGFEELNRTSRLAAMWTSDDQGATWTRVESDSFAGQATDARMRDLEAGPNGVLVAVGLEVIGNDTNGAAWVSSDGGVTWTQDTLDGPQLGGAGEQNIATVVAGGPGFVAVGEDGDDAGIWTSTDGTRWRQEIASAEGADNGVQALIFVVPTATGFTAVGNESGPEGIDAAVWTSENGIVWDRLPDASFEGPADDKMFGAACFSGRLVGVGSSTTEGVEVGAAWLGPGGSC